MDFKEVGAVALDTGMRIGLKILGAIVLWVVGRMLIGLAARMAHNALERQRVDITLARWIRSILVVALNIVLVVAILGVFGVETTALAALMAAAGIAVGMAWSGLLSNFAAGAFLMVLRPFHAGDFVTAGGVTGTVLEVGLFTTTMTAPDNVRTIVGNSKIFSDTIQNYSANPFRRVEMVAQLAHGVDPNLAIGLLKERLGKIPNVLMAPAPDVEILAVHAGGPRPRGAPVLQQHPLLAGLLPYEPDHPRGLWHGRIPGAPEHIAAVVRLDVVTRWLAALGLAVVLGGCSTAGPAGSTSRRWPGPRGSPRTSTGTVSSAARRPRSCSTPRSASAAGPPAISTSARRSAARAPGSS